MRKPAITTIVAMLACCTAAFAAGRYEPVVLVASDASYNPTILVDPDLSNPWGMALRPPGAGGHFWTSNFNTGTTTTYVGDANGVPMHQDSLRVVRIGMGSGLNAEGGPVADPPQPTGQVYNYSSTDFVVSGEGMTAASKFIFVTAEGTISGWTEVPDPLPDDPNHKRRQTVSVVKVDHSEGYDNDVLRYVGCAVTDFAADNRLYVANLAEGVVEVYDSNWQHVTIPEGRFHYPGQQQDYLCWNIQYFHTGPHGEGRLWVSYAQADDPWEQHSDTGEVAEFDLDGNFIRKLHQITEVDPLANGELGAPWGLAIAPANFGPLSGAMLVANFGTGTVAGFDLATGHFIDYLRDIDDEPLSIDGLWGLAFGNGVSLGDSNALYYTAGPNTEQDGVFGVIRFVRDSPCTSDLNTDNAVNTADLVHFLGKFGTQVPAWTSGDLTGDGHVDTADLIVLLGDFGGGC